MLEKLRFAWAANKKSELRESRSSLFCKEPIGLPRAANVVNAELVGVARPRRGVTEAAQSAG